MQNDEDVPDKLPPYQYECASASINLPLRSTKSLKTPHDDDEGYFSRKVSVESTVSTSSSSSSSSDTSEPPAGLGRVVYGRESSTPEPDTDESDDQLSG